MKTALVLKDIFPETNKYVYVLRTKFQVSSIILKSFRQRVQRGVGLKLAPPSPPQNEASKSSPRLRLIKLQISDLTLSKALNFCRVMW